jgi:hypothetical protein
MAIAPKETAPKEIVALIIAKAPTQGPGAQYNTAQASPAAELPSNNLLILGGLYWGLPGAIVAIIMVRTVMLKRRAKRLQQQIESLERLWQKNRLG